MNAATRATQALETLKELCVNHKEVIRKMLGLLQAINGSPRAGARDEPSGICYPCSGADPFTSTKAQCDIVPGIWSGTGPVTMTEYNAYVNKVLKTSPNETKARELNQLCNGDQKRVIQQVVLALYEANKDRPGDPIGICLPATGDPPFPTTKGQCVGGGSWSAVAIHRKDGTVSGSPCPTK